MSDPKNQDNSRRPIPISTDEFDRKVEAGEDIDDHIDWDNAVSVMPGKFSAEVMMNLQAQAANRPSNSERNEPSGASLLQIALPGWIYDRLQTEAVRKGVSREELAQQLIVRQFEQEQILT